MHGTIKFKFPNDIIKWQMGFNLAFKGLNGFKMLDFTLGFPINAPTCFSLTKPSSGILQSVLR
jgi:hypothetical protein